MSKYNPLLYGKSDTEGIVGIIPFKKDEIKYFVREDGIVKSYTKRCWAVFLTTEAGADEVQKHHGPEWERGNHAIVELKDHEHGFYNRAILSRNSSNNYKLRKELSAKSLPYRTIGSRAAQWLVQTGNTMMKGMNVNTIRRMQIDIETLSLSGGFPNPEKPEDEIFIIAISDNHGFETVLHTGKNARNDDTYVYCENEKEMLLKTIKIVQMRDPDVIEGHNFYSFDMRYMMVRCDHHEIEFTIGRDQKKPRIQRDSRAKFAEQEMVFDEYHVGGRTIVDTMFLVKAFDAQKRVLQSHGLKHAAKYFGVTRKDRVYIEGDKLTETWLKDPNAVLEYALDDVWETRGLSSKLLPATFALTQMVPDQFQRVHVGGVGKAIELLFIRHYLKERTAIPTPEGETQQFGGLVGVCKTGRIGPILYIDVASLYPSIMLLYKVMPESDHLGLFQQLLSILTELRLKTKDAMNNEENEELKTVLDAEQTAYKIIINSFYGVLGASTFAWSDVSEADRVATTGQQILWRMIDVTTKLGCQLVECDTDGILTIAPPGFDMAKGLEFVKNEVEPLMPRGIKLDLDGSFQWMLSYKKKNYALIDYKGKVKFKGVAWKSRGMEKFGRDYLAKAIKWMLLGQYKEMRDEFERIKLRIIQKQMDVEEFQVKRNLKMSLEEYETSPVAAQYEIWKRDPDRWAPGDPVHYWVAAHGRKSKAVKVAVDARHVDEYQKGKENSTWYFKRLLKIVEKFEVFFDDVSYGMIFEKRNKSGTLSLFEEDTFDVDSIVTPVEDVMDVSELEKTMHRNQARYAAIYN